MTIPQVGQSIMQYKDIRSKIRKGDLISLTHEQWGTRHDLEIQLVRFATRSEYCHSAIAYPMEGRVYVIEAVKPLVRIFPLSNLGESFFWMPMNLTMTEDSRVFAHSKVGEPYSNKEAIRGQLSHTHPEDGLWQCSELYRETMMLNGFPQGKNTPAQLIKDGQDMGKPLYKVKL